LTIILAESWRITDDNIATIDNQGKVTALASRNVQVIAQVEKFTAYHDLTVGTDFFDFFYQNIPDYESKTVIPDTGSTSYASLFLVGALIMAVGAIVLRN